MPALLLAALAALILFAADATAQSLKTVTVAKGLQHPWGLAFLPDGRMLVTERPGRLRLVSREGALERTGGRAFLEVDARGQGGLLDVAIDPNFVENHRVYLSYSESGEGGNSTAVARGRLDGERLADVKVIFRQAPKYGSTSHFGSRFVFDAGWPALHHAG